MITGIRLKNFKSLSDIELKLSSLNILAGLNGMGKSSVMQSLLLLRQSNQNTMINAVGLALKGSLIDIGVGKDVLYQYAENEEIEIQLKTSETELVWRFGYETDSDLLPFSSDYKPPPDDIKGISLFNNHFQYLQAEHWIPKNTFERSDYEVVQRGSLGNRGEFAPHYLAVYAGKSVPLTMIHPKGQSTTLLHQTQAWLGEISPGTKINSKDIPNLDTIRLTYQFETEGGFTNEFKHFNVGFGITYALPVIVALLSASKGDLILIENPESHLHPKGQSAMGKLISLAAQRGVQLIVETHSDHLLNATRVAVKNDDLDKANLSLTYFDRNHQNTSQHSTEITPIRIDDKGELDTYPQGFLDEWGNQLMHLV